MNERLGQRETLTARRLLLRGHVQGVGMRPAVARAAAALALHGFARNTEQGVEIHVEGHPDAVRLFESKLLSKLPVEARPVMQESKEADVGHLSAFAIVADDRVHDGQSLCLSTRVPSDVVSCVRCIEEVQGAGRRRNHAFTSCCDCGPRYSIIGKMPFERLGTAMRGYPLCDACRSEYESMGDRRFHAQTICCPACGPQIAIRDRDGLAMSGGDDPIEVAACFLRQGKILALRGIGGYQLLVDASSQVAVERLRARKRRRCKPLAVMVASEHEANQLAYLNELERRILNSSAGPIVIAELRSDVPLAASVSKGFRTVGLLLPTTPLHFLLLRAAELPLVCTSGNLDGEPLLFETSEAKQLGEIADAWLEHDRPIFRPIDDSVVRVMAGKAVTLRLARGYAPLTLDLAMDQATIAAGGHQKSALAIANTAQSVLGAHVGDLDTLAMRQRYLQHDSMLSELYGVGTPLRVCDRHPDYFSTRWASSQPNESLRVQHHHAHLAAAALEHGLADRDVLGVIFDGTGYGDDGTVWGGEFLIGSPRSVRRVAHLRRFRLPGGERAVQEPWRVAMDLVRDAAGEEAVVRVIPGADRLLAVSRRPQLSPSTTSAGRLFDAVAFLTLGVMRSDFEGHPAMALEAACDRAARGAYRIPLTDDSPRQLDWRPLIRHLLRDRTNGEPASVIAMRFHRGLADAVVACCSKFRGYPAVLGGGVFQNRVLLELLVERFEQQDLSLKLPGRIPPNDGGLAAGQLAIAAALEREFDGSITE